uniref:hypothetical protein n=1 Tax=Faecalicatena contorta TaxID=39482 RepID=UPI00359C494D
PISGPGCIGNDIFEINVSTNIDNIKPKAVNLFNGFAAFFVPILAFLEITCIKNKRKFATGFGKIPF